MATDRERYIDRSRMRRERPLLLDNAVLVCQYGGIISVREIEIEEPEIEEVPERGTVKIENGKYYKIVVGPKILDPNCDDAARLQADDYGGQIYRRIDVELEKKPDFKTNNESEDHLTLECVACGVKAHTYNIHPDTTPEHAHKIFEYNKNITASFDIENGFVQTGIAYPNSWNAQNDSPTDGPIAADYMDGSVIEFWGNSVDFSPREYKLVGIIVLDEDESEE